MPILVSGSLVYDHIMDFPDRFKNHILPESIHILNVCFTVDKLEKSKGGTAGNIAYNLKLLGADPIVVSSVGKDGSEYLNYFKKLQIATDLIGVHEKKHSASCYITTDRDDNQITAFHNGALESAPDIKFEKSKKKPEWAIISPTQKNVMLAHLSQCADSGIKIIFDPGQQIPAFSKGELKKSILESQVLIGNDYEIKMIQKRTGWSEKDILKKTKMLVTTFGERGSLVKTSDKQEIRVEAAKPKKIVDPTGAGDAYRAGFLFGLEKGYNLRGCARIGSIAASFAIEKYGTQEHLFSLAEFEKRYKKSYREDIRL
ncbi:MAG: carbohydrate kinase family protein [Patescibacteria group bacterium]|nr:carbohydrate kinase family protein [Patescibacteria group bacterium]